jgi:thiol-disulfide isomerase/thioredoxin
VKGETPEELMAFIESLKQSMLRVPGATQAEKMSNAQNLLASMIAAAEKVLGHSEADAETIRSAAETKIGALSQMAQFGVTDAEQHLAVFCDELTKHDNPDAAQVGKRMTFVFAVDDFASGENDNAAALLDKFNGFFGSEPKNQQTFMLGNSVANVFEQRGFKAEAVAVFKAIATTFAETDDPQLQNAVAQLAEQAQLVEIGLRQKLNAYMTGQEGALEPLLAGLDTLLQGDKPGDVTISVGREVATYLEARHPEQVRELYAKLGEAFKDDPKRSEDVKKAAEMYEKRSAIVGKPFTVEGVKLDGSPFDWSQYAGKVVLVDFWATWCQPCLIEIPRIKQNLDRYRDKGFEVVSVNLDDQRSRLTSFLQIQPLPWPIVVSPDEGAVGFNSPMAVKCGVEAIPFIVLVDRSGTAIALNVRGEALDQKLAELFQEKPAP